MSLLKWKELAKRKTELGNKINYAHNAITQHKIGQETSQESFEKVFKPVTTKLDDVVKRNLNLRMPQMRKRPLRKAEVPDYGVDIEDEVEDMGLDELFGDYVPPQQDKQLAPEPPQYKPSLEDILEEPESEDDEDENADPPKAPPGYDYDEEVDYGILDEDLAMERLHELNLTNYQDLEEVYNNPEMARKNKLIYFKMTINKAEKERNRLKGSKANVTKKIQ